MDLQERFHDYPFIRIGDGKFYNCHKKWYQIKYRLKTDKFYLVSDNNLDSPAARFNIYRGADLQKMLDEQEETISHWRICLLDFASEETAQKVLTEKFGLIFEA